MKKREFMEVIANFFEKLIIIIGYICISFLFLLSIFSTAYMDIDRKTYFLSDSVLLNGLIIVIFCAILIVLGLLVRTREKAEKIKYLVLFLVVGIECVFILFGVKYQPVSDQRVIVTIAEEWARGNFDAGFENNGYLICYPFNSGITYFIYILELVTGDAVFWFRVVNLISLIGIYYLFSKNIQGDNKSDSLVISALYFPPVLFITFVYGNILGLVFSLLSFYLYRKYIYSERGTKYLGGCLICAFLSIALKGNSILIILSLLLFHFIYMLRNWQIRKNVRKNICFLVLLLLVVSNSSNISQRLVYKIAGQYIEDYISTAPICIAMGIMPQEDRRFDGWVNGIWYNEIREEANQDFNVCNTIALKYIDERVDYLIEEPIYTIEFISKKNSSQWNNPVFEGWWINLMQGRYGEADTFFEKQILVEPIMYIISVYLNYFQSVLLFFCLAALLFNYNNNHMFFILAFLSGFFFFSVWEAQSLNTLWHFICLTPLAADGMGYMRQVGMKINSKGIKFFGVRQMTIISILILLIVIIGVSNKNIVSRVFKGNSDEEYLEYIDMMSNVSNEEYLDLYHDGPLQ